jgi:spore coat polysaccharide biosynthesis protein SpsF|tara:strand:- start:329 stop:832 length:504 start_codon:yes stop_codon:yes gene_type:complete
MMENLKEITIRKACKEDFKLLWNWANDIDVRANSLNPEIISMTNHKEWLKKRIRSNDTLIYILESKGIPFSQIRFDRISQNEAEIDISVSREWRSKGLGTLTLTQTKLRAIEQLRILLLTGVVREANIGSCKAFINAGFIESDKRNINGNICRVFHWESNQNPSLNN